MIEKIFEYALAADNIVLAFLILAIIALVWMVRWVLKTNDIRETRYMATIEKFADKLEVVDNIKATVERIESRIYK